MINIHIIWHCIYDRIYAVLRIYAHPWYTYFVSAPSVLKKPIGVQAAELDDIKTSSDPPRNRIRPPPPSPPRQPVSRVAQPRVMIPGCISRGHIDARSRLKGRKKMQMYQHIYIPWYMCTSTGGNERVFSSAAAVRARSGGTGDLGAWRASDLTSAISCYSIPLVCQDILIFRDGASLLFCFRWWGNVRGRCFFRLARWDPLPRGLLRFYELFARSYCLHSIEWMTGWNFAVISVYFDSS